MEQLYSKLDSTSLMQVFSLDGFCRCTDYITSKKVLTELKILILDIHSCRSTGKYDNYVKVVHIHMRYYYNNPS